MIAVIITADRETLEFVTELLSYKNKIMRLTTPTTWDTKDTSNVSKQIEKQLAPEVCPLLLSLAEGKK